MPRVPTREVSPMVAKFREFLMGRKHTNNLRFQEALSERPGPQANLPEGPSHKVAFNYYHTRDGRREVAPPKVLADAQEVLALASGEGQAKTVAAKPKTPEAPFSYSQAF